MKDFTVLYGEEAPDDPMRIEVYQKEAFSMGPATIKVFMFPVDGEKQLLLTEKIYNDGSNLQIKNAGIIWQTDQRAKLYIRGKEQETKVYLIDYSNTESIEIELEEGE